MRKIAYVSFETKRPAIYVQDLATGQREKLASFRGLNGAPSFSQMARACYLRRLCMVTRKSIR